MRAFCVLLGLLAFLAGLITGEILELDDDNFEQTVKSSPLVLVDFYVPWCPHCTNLNPEFTQADSVLAKTQPTVRLAKVNCNAFNTKRICKDNNVRFLPWLVLFSQGKSFKLYGDLPRDAPTIIKFMNTAVQKPDLLDSLQDSTPQNKMQPKDTCDEASKDQGAAPDPASPAVLNLNDQNFNETIKKNEYVLVDFYAPWCSDCQRLSPLFDTAALQLRDNNPSLRFAKVVCDKGHADSFGVCGEAHLKFFPWVVLYHNSQQVKTYPFENWPDTSAIFDFIEGGMRDSPPNPENKDLPSQIKQIKKRLDPDSASDSLMASDGVPDDEPTLLELDDSNFEPAVQKHKFVLVDFYAPWCFHCKKMAPDYKDVAKELLILSHNSVRLAKVDCSANNMATKKTCKKYNVKFLPTIYLFHDGKFVEEFEGNNRNKKSIKGFVMDAVKEADPSMKFSDVPKKKKMKNQKQKSIKFVHKPMKDEVKHIQGGAKAEVHDKEKDSGLKVQAGQAGQADQKDQNATNEKAKDKNTKPESLQEIIKKVESEEKTVINSTETANIAAKNESKKEEKANDAPRDSKPADSASTAADVIQAVAQNMLKALQPNKEKNTATPAKLEDTLPEIVKDLHQVAQDLHQVTQDLHKMADQQPAFERLVKELHDVVASKKADSSTK